ncbi:phosphoribosylaminoimidazolesuccinocarboxamide synthase [Corynebacterium qintianiae]|uniref:Phosphoribosylaminoimidazole-succinocarboxamide synthase n=1 Tax=Corynebacterium qintianiae TaxID=2709392 RepID=A0A7T0PFM2_9CORY|nr:phosphoribosylaminoimidazolesuccinocarboxamide synthase [Corynebacterium qintianiae]QPK82967.1 phosphoribosylaminoimidazolesuccinocarboxamide synthase [Corynebacterium qintianiae]
MRPELSDYTHLSGGKVREIYEVDRDTLLMMATDRISAFDFPLDPEIPDKGRILTATSTFFFDLLQRELNFPNHLAGPVEDERVPEEVLGRAHVVKKLDMIPFECVARGYLTGSGKKEYDATGRVCGVALPEGLVEASKLPEPIFTPATKAEQGDHDENVTFAYVASKLGDRLATELKEATLAIYTAAATYAESRGIILADTKLEFGLDSDGTLVLADEVLTPDSSRYWPADSYEAGKVQPSFDKQYVRNWLTGPKSGWDPAGDVEPPELPGSVVEATRDRYIEAYERLSGEKFCNWPGANA